MQTKQLQVTLGNGASRTLVLAKAIFFICLLRGLFIVLLLRSFL
jgi:hypothetical protein